MRAAAAAAAALEMARNVEIERDVSGMNFCVFITNLIVTSNIYVKPALLSPN